MFCILLLLLFVSEFVNFIEKHLDIFRFLATLRF